MFLFLLHSSVSSLFTLLFPPLPILTFYDPPPSSSPSSSSLRCCSMSSPAPKLQHTHTHTHGLAVASSFPPDTRCLPGRLSPLTPGLRGAPGGGNSGLTDVPASDLLRNETTCSGGSSSMRTSSAQGALRVMPRPR